MHQLIELSTVRNLQPQDILFQEGDPADAFYIVAEGEMELSSTGGLQKAFKEGDFFGELALLGKAKRSATLIAKSEARLLVFTETALAQSFKNWPEFPKNVFHFFNLRLFLNSARASLVLKDLSEAALEDIFRLFTPTRFSAGSLILEEGNSSDCLYLLVKGTCDIIRKQTRISTLGPGQFLGEIGVLKNEPRIATVKAVTDSILLKCTGDHLVTLFDRYPKVRHLLDEIAHMRADSTAQM